MKPQEQEEYERALDRRDRFSALAFAGIVAGFLALVFCATSSYRACTPALGLACLAYVAWCVRTERRLHDEAEGSGAGAAPVRRSTR